MAAKRDLAEQAAEELYGLPPGEFTRARDERAKELRGSGDRAAADAVKALRKPTVAAWALNQLARERGKELDRLLSAGETLRAAQEELLAGGDRSAFQEAATAERDLVAELTAAAREIVSASGERPGAGVEEKVSATLHAAALDEETAEELRAGRLTREREAIGGFGALAAGSPPPAPKDRKAKKEKAAPAASKETTSSKRAAADARKRERLAGARTDERHARRELEAAEKALESARTRAEAAEAHAADAVERAKVASERLKEARRAQSAAKKAHARAEKSLKGAERG